MRQYPLLLVLSAMFLSGPLRAQVPKLVNYQGRVAVDTVNFEGAGQFKFALVNSNGTNTFWSNDGTSVGGSQPAAAVTLVVAKGLYSVLLGDTTLGNMTTISASAFTNPDVRLRVWFNDGVHGSQLLTPDQRLAPAAYLADGTVTSASLGNAVVTSGKIAAGAVSAGNIAPASVTSGNFATVGSPNNGQVLGYNNGNLTWTASGGGVFSLNGTNAYYNGGNVGIGTTAPAATFESNGLIRSTRVGIAVQYIQLNGGDPNSINLTAQSSVAAEKNLFIENLSGEAAPGANNNIQFVLGTTAARSTKMTLNKDGNLILPLGGSGGGLQIGTPNFETGMSIVGSNRADIRFDGSTLKLLAGAGTGIPSNTNGITVNTSGNVGIGGSLTPVAKLEVVANDALRLIGNGGAYLTILDSGAGFARARLQSVAGELFFGPESWVNSTNPNAFIKLANSGNVGIGTTNPIAKLQSETNQVGTSAIYGKATATGGVGVYGQSAVGPAVHAEGNATQARDKGGFVKAMLSVNSLGQIVRCYNGVTGSSTGDCEFVVTHPVGTDGVCRITFPFQISDRFFSISAEYDSFGGFNGNNNVGANYRVLNSTSIEAFTFQTDDVQNTVYASFMLIVY